MTDAELSKAIEVEAERDQLRIALTWRPIETAPKTGQKILLADYSGYASIGDNGMWIASGHWTLDLSLTGGYWTDGDRLYTPSHWMPLPEPPK